MAKPTIKATVNGPYELCGEVDVVDVKGVMHPATGRPVRLCRCGQSKNKPFCDGSHVTCGFKDP
jgi:CDGSH-type Zn-finger protein